MVKNSNNAVDVNEKEAEEICSQNSDLGGEELDQLESRTRAESLHGDSLSLRNGVINGKLKLT